MYCLCVCVLLQIAQTPNSEQIEEGPLFGAGSEGGAQAFLSEISEEDVEVLRQREEALLQIEVSTVTYDQLSCIHQIQRSHSSPTQMLTGTIPVSL